MEDDQKKLRMEDELNFLKMEDNINLFENERWPYIFFKLEVSKMEDNLIFWKWKTTSTFLKIKADLNFILNRRQTQKNNAT